jgi:glycosyltransferase involved in cell wall biosynthesis
MIAAKLCNIPVRIYHIRGFTFRSNLGWKKKLLTLTERVSCKCATAVLAHSQSLKSIALEQGFVDEAKVQVIINGSNGVDSKSLFNPSNFSAKDRMLLRQKFGIAEKDLVVSCIARQMIAKGYVELVNAWSLVRAQFPHAWLLVIGHAEEHDALPPETTSAMASDPSIVQVGGIDKKLSPAFYHCSDLIVLPTYREGFPNVPLEAAAMGLPIVATQVEGCTDAVIDGVTGTLVPPKTIEPLAKAIIHYLASPELRMKHGKAAQLRVQKEFQREIIWEAQYEFYLSQLKNA